MSYQELLANLRSSTYASNVGWLIRGNLIAQVLQVLALPLISRIYTPDDFGAYSVLVAFVGFAAVGLTLRYESALLIARPEEVDALKAACMRLVLLMSIFGSATLYLLSEGALFGFEILPFWAVIMVIPILAGHGFFNIGRADRLRHLDARTVSGARIQKSVFNVATKISIGFVLAGPFGLIAGEIAGAWAAFRRVGGGFGDLLIRSGCLVQRRASIWKRYRKFPLIETPSALADQAALLLPVTMIAAIGGASAAGAFGMARIIVVLPNAQIGRAVADGFQSRASELVRCEETGKLLPLCWKTVSALVATGIVPYGLLFFLAPWVIPLVLGVEWHLAGEFAALLSIWMFSAFVVSPVSRLLSVIKRQEFKLIYDFIVLIGSVLIYFHAQATSIDPITFVQNLVVLNIAAYLLYFILIVCVARQTAKRGNFQKDV